MRRSFSGFPWARARELGPVDSRLVARVASRVVATTVVTAAALSLLVEPSTAKAKTAYTPMTRRDDDKNLLFFYAVSSCTRRLLAMERRL